MIRPFILATATLLAFSGCTPISPEDTPPATAPKQAGVPVAKKAPAAPKSTPAVNAPSAADSEARFLAEIDDANNVFFSLGSSSIPGSQRGKLQEISRQLAASDEMTVTLAGFANDNGSPSFNLAVADSRINSVYAFLRKQGVAARQMRRLVIGSEQMPAYCRSNACRQKMRRVELRINAAE